MQEFYESPVISHVLRKLNEGGFGIRKLDWILDYNLYGRPRSVLQKPFYVKFAEKYKS